MHRPLRRLALACLLTGVCVQAWPQGSIYACTDARGRRLNSDRPIPECLDREQKLLNPSGTVRQTVGPTLTPAERAAQEERDRKAAEERQRQAEDKRVQKLLLARYPNAAAHEAERAKALRPVEEAIASGQRHVQELQAQRSALMAEAPKNRTADQLKRQLDDNEQQIAAQQRFIAGQDEEKARITRRFDEELARLKLLWVQPSGSTAAAAAPGPGPAPVR
jgi:hypothetical protein